MGPASPRNADNDLAIELKKRRRRSNSRLDLYHVGEESLPIAYIRIAAKMKAGAPRELLDDTEIVFLLESILQRQVYSKPVELKRREYLRTAVLYLLDQLVDAGSSAAFRMRDDFVTPLPAQVAAVAASVVE